MPRSSREWVIKANISAGKLAPRQNWPIEPFAAIIRDTLNPLQWVALGNTPTLSWIRPFFLRPRRRRHRRTVAAHRAAVDSGGDTLCPLGAGATAADLRSPAIRRHRTAVRREPRVVETKQAGGDPRCERWNRNQPLDNTTTGLRGLDNGYHHGRSHSLACDTAGTKKQPCKPTGNEHRG